jgi:hypothetical protein
MKKNYDLINDIYKINPSNTLNKQKIKDECFIIDYKKLILHIGI